MLLENPVINLACIVGALVSYIGIIPLVLWLGTDRSTQAEAPDKH